MKRKNMTRSALVTSILALLVCVSMLVGTTFAWFTDSVVSGVNTIAAGNLDVELEYAVFNTDGTFKEWKTVKGATELFTDELWEPGHTEVVYLKLSNLGTLALKYQLGINVASEIAGTNVAGNPFNLSDVLEFGVINGVNGENPYADRIAARNAVTTSTKLSVGYNVDYTTMASGHAEYLAMVVYMPESVGNEANYKTGTARPEINLGINLVATQQAVEMDSFGDDYDAEAVYPAHSTAYILDGTTTPTAITVGEVTVYIPAGAAAGTYRLMVDNKTVTTENETETVSYDISLYKDDVKVSGTIYPVDIKIGRMLNVVSLTHSGVDISNYTYDAMQGVISFETDSFSPFAVTYKTIPNSGVEINGNKIVAGVFEGINPAELDPTLAEENSDYIAINYEADGKTCYVVSKRSTTVIVAADDAADYTAENGNYTVTKNQSGKLWSLISGLQNNEHSTVYLLPGTYNEGTTIYVYSSMDIIGLGDKDTVKVVKLSSSSSNRHLFNCNGTKADYIEVTLRNLYLDATAKTTNSKDNAAVQSIRKSKVKCYDLTIVKGTGWDAVAFYVNGSNAVDGVMYPAYLYAENCSLNTTQSFGVVTTSGSYKFYHSGLTYGGTAYTQNSSSIKNQMMEPNDWTWD